MQNTFKRFGTRSRWWLLVAALIAVTVWGLLTTGCEGPIGPQGKDGANGTPGTQGEPGEAGKTAYLVIFDSNGGNSALGMAAVSHGGKLAKPADPAKAATGLYAGTVTEEKNLSSGKKDLTRRIRGALK